MSDVVASPQSGHETAPVDACDVVDAFNTEVTTTFVPASPDMVEDDEADADADFQAFTGGAQTLEGETVAEARLAAAAAAVAAATASGERADGNNPVVHENNNSSTVAHSATVPESTGTIESLQNDEILDDDPRKRFVTPKDFVLLKVIGMGAFGKVLQVKNKVSGQILAMKVMSKRLLKRKSGYIENIQAERNILKRVNHPFVVTMHCSFQTKEKLFIIMDYLAGGELFLRLGREGIFLEKDAAFYLGEIILGMDHLHGLRIIHR